MGSGPIDTDAAVTQLLDEAGAVSPATFLAGDRRALAVPGLYSWWVDGAGAADLSRGLGLPVTAGLVYAGLAAPRAGRVGSARPTPCGPASRACTSAAGTSSPPSAGPSVPSSLLLTGVTASMSST